MGLLLYFSSIATFPSSSVASCNNITTSQEGCTNAMFLVSLSHLLPPRQHQTPASTNHVLHLHNEFPSQTKFAFFSYRLSGPRGRYKSPWSGDPRHLLYPKYTVSTPNLKLLTVSFLDISAYVYLSCRSDYTSFLCSFCKHNFFLITNIRLDVFTLDLMALAFLSEAMS